ncbi:MAG: zinc-dependent alcohol dehydrogenase family protein [Gammaproteobacteria bacterium]|nr:zinc-dependent alcohol dehydrogenase family protein [Gammaproteobacteria bacterium]
MEAMIIRQFGAPDIFEKASVARPQIYPGQVLIKVAATSVNPVDCKIRQGKLAAIAPDFPAILHGDVAGAIEEVGDNVAGFNIGDEVYACAGGVKGMGGALAEYILADARLVAHKPAGLSFREAAALPLVSITAWTALIDKARIQAGQQVLIHGATGGVGHVGIQLAKARGATVYATCASDTKAAIAKDLGADYVINYRQMDVTTYVEKYTGGKGFDVVFDTVGGDNIQKSFATAALNGAVVSVSTRSIQDLSLMHAKGLSLHVVFMLIPLLYDVGREHHGMILREITQLADRSQLRPLIDDSVFKITDVGAAHQKLESGKALGKIVLEAW